MALGVVLDGMTRFSPCLRPRRTPSWFARRRCRSGDGDATETLDEEIGHEARHPANWLECPK